LAVSGPSRLLSELKRRNVLRAGALYIGAVWALAQGIAQLGPAFGAPDWVTRWFTIAGIVGFPFWIAFAWFFEFTPEGLKLERDIEPGASITHHTGRKLDFWIIGVLAVAVVLLLTNQIVSRRGASAGISDQSIAVLPLVNEGGNADEQYFSDGLSEDLIITLSHFASLKVISRNSSFQFRDSKDDSRAIAAKLGVAHLLEGSVRRVGDAVRISAALVHAADGSTLWSERYDRPYRDLFALQDEISNAVAGALKAKLLTGGSTAVQTDRPPSGNLDAYAAYLQAAFYNARGTEADHQQAVAHYTTAIRLDPHYARAWAGLSEEWTGYAQQSLEGDAAQQAYAEARKAADRAVQLQPDLAAAYAARATLKRNGDFDWAGAEADSQRAVDLAPGDGSAKFSLGVSLATLGKPREAITLTQQAIAINPLRASWHTWLSSYFSSLGRLDEAEAAIRRSLGLQPDGTAYYEALAVVQIQRGDAAAALKAAQSEPEGSWQDIALALARQIGDDRAAADAALQKLIDKNATFAPFQIAEVYALRRDPDKTFEWLEHTWTNRDPGITSLLTDPFILRYRDDPRFAAFCKKAGLPATTEAKALP
jgi:TolB-like protein/Tfp pilus assembly protein PilF